MTGLRFIENQISRFQYHPTFIEAGWATPLFNLHKIVGIGIINSIVNSGLRIFTGIPTTIYDLAFGIIFQDKTHLKDGVLTIPKVILHLTVDSIALTGSLAITAVVVSYIALASLVRFGQEIVVCTGQLLSAVYNA